MVNDHYKTYSRIIKHHCQQLLTTIVKHRQTPLSHIVKTIVENHQTPCSKIIKTNTVNNCQQKHGTAEDDKAWQVLHVKMHCKSNTPGQKNMQITHDSERANTRNHRTPQGKGAVARVRHALSYGAMPFRLDVWMLFCVGMVPP
jgi:hypothetical protein